MMASLRYLLWKLSTLKALMLLARASGSGASCKKSRPQCQSISQKRRHQLDVAIKEL